jgi:hypothetical protein
MSILTIYGGGLLHPWALFRSVLIQGRDHHGLVGNLTVMGSRVLPLA